MSQLVRKLVVDLQIHWYRTPRRISEDPVVFIIADIPGVVCAHVFYHNKKYPTY